jgi:hypothetical protein
MAACELSEFVFRRPALAPAHDEPRHYQEKRKNDEKWDPKPHG